MNYHLLKYYRLLLPLILIMLASCEGEVKNVEVPHHIAEVEIGDNLFINPDSAIIAIKAEELDNKFKSLVKLTGFNGTVLYAEKGKVVFQKAYGYRNIRSKKEELTTSDAFQLASVSKMFSAMAIMILKNDGKLDYDIDVRNYLPTFPYENITIRMLLTHRAGLPRYMSLAHDKWSNKKIPMNNDDMLDLFVEHVPDSYFTADNGFHIVIQTMQYLLTLLRK